MAQRRKSCRGGGWRDDPVSVRFVGVGVDLGASCCSRAALARAWGVLICAARATWVYIEEGLDRFMSGSAPSVSCHGSGVGWRCRFGLVGIFGKDGVYGIGVTGHGPRVTGHGSSELESMVLWFLSDVSGLDVGYRTGVVWRGVLLMC